MWTIFHHPNIKSNQLTNSNTVIPVVEPHIIRYQIVLFFRCLPIASIDSKLFVRASVLVRTSYK